MAPDRPDLAKGRVGTIWGRHPVEEAFHVGQPVTRLMVARGAMRSTQQLRTLAGMANVPVTFVDSAELDELAFGGNHQGVVATLAETPIASIHDLIKPMPGRVQPALILAFDQVEDVGNVGSLIRTLEAYGGSGAIMPVRRSAPLTGGLARASAGASLRSAIVTVTNLARSLQTLRKEGVQTIGLDADAKRPFDALTYDAPCCVVVGSESRGLRDGVRRICNEIVKVPMQGAIGSLNVAAAGAIVLHHIGRSRMDTDS